MTQDDQLSKRRGRQTNAAPIMCQAAVRELSYPKRGGHWRRCTQRRWTEVVHRQDGQPISLCPQHARIHAEDVLTPLIRWCPQDEGDPNRRPPSV